MAQEFYLTSEALKKLKEELDCSRTTKRMEIAERLKSAKDLGDLSENAEYADAKEEQAFNEGKILELEEKIRNAVIFKESHTNKSIVTIGSTVKVKGPTGEKGYTIVGSQEANPSEGKISNESPLGSAFLGNKLGDTVEAQLPNGKQNYKILEIN